MRDDSGRDLNTVEAEEEFMDSVDRSYLESVHFALNQVGPHGEPTSYRQAMGSAESGEWYTAIQDEFASLKKMEVWDVVPRPEDHTVVGRKWVFRKKTNANGDVVRFKARLVAKGYTQIPGMDFSDTHAPVTRLETLHLLLALAVQYDWEIRQIDVKTAYLYGNLDEEIFMEAPEGLEVPEGHVLHLKKALYGLRQAGRQWYKKLKSTLEKFGCVQVLCEPNTFVVRKVIKGQPCVLILPIYVDDLMPMGDKAMTNLFELNIGKYFDTTPPTDATLFLGIQLTRNRTANPPFLELDQFHYVTESLAKLDHDHSLNTTPLLVTERLQPNSEPKENANPDCVRQYQVLIGTAMWLMLGTHPDLAFAVGKLARFSSNPAPEHFAMVDRLYNYIYWSADFALRFTKQDNPTPPICYTDADFANDRSDQISVSGYVFTAFGTPVSWSSKKQKEVATSTAEAEYTAIFHASQQAFWIRQFAEEIGYALTEPLRVYTDSTTALAIAKGTQAHTRSKHIDIRYHKIRERVTNKVIELVYVRSKDNLADIMTKQLSRSAHHKALVALGFNIDEDTPISPPEPSNNNAEEQEVSQLLGDDEEEEES